MVKIYKQPFAHDGDTIAIPDASQPDGKMSSADGWTPDYQLPKTDPNYKPVGRQEMNGVFKEVTEALGQVQVQGAATWSPDGAPYPINAQVYHDGKQWIALRDNSVEPAEGDDWQELLFGNLVPASETIRGVIQLATEVQAQALTASEVAITPETLGAAMNSHVLGMGQTWEVASRSNDVTYTNTTGRTIVITISTRDAYVATGFFYVDGVLVARQDGASTQVLGSSDTVLVPPGSTYMFTGYVNYTVAILQ